MNPLEGNPQKESDNTIQEKRIHDMLIRVLQGIIIAERKVLQEKCSAVHHHYFLLECPSVS